MVRAFVFRVLLLVCFVFSLQTARAQYYSWGADPASFVWQKINQDDVSVLYPEHTEALARRVLYYIDAVQPTINEGFEYGPLNIPFVIHPENFASNGLVMWLPKRIEFISTPATESYSMLWTKQLVAHEYRHAVQYNNLNRGWLRPLNFVFGQHAAVAGLAFMPLYGLEGDAVLAETSMSSFGRGLQPSYTMEYRALGRDILKKRNSDYMLGGSYRVNIPDHYIFGYQLSSYGMRKYGENIWEKVTRFAVRNPYLIATTNSAMKKYYGTNVDGYIRETFNALFDYWDDLPEQEDTLQRITQLDSTNYTTYSHPQALADGSVLAFKRDFSQAQRIVRITSNGEEELVARIGNPSTRPLYLAGRLWWSEYRRSTLFEQKVNSVICCVDIADGKLQTVKGIDNALYPTALDASLQSIAYVAYEPSGEYFVVLYDFEKGELKRLQMPSQTEIHGLAWDNKTRQLYFLATDNEGMYLGEVAADFSDVKALTKSAFVSLSDLSAADGKLYFGSIASGYDELHCFDLSSGREQRLTRSKFGSFDATKSTSGYLYGTVYNKYGYSVARQKSEAYSEDVEWSKLPKNVVNPEGGLYDMVNLDEVDYTPHIAAEQEAKNGSKKYRKGLNLFNIHSWMPLAFNPFNLDAEQTFNFNAGATIVSQNTLSSTEGYASYSYDSLSEDWVLNGEIRNNMFGVELSAAATYGGDVIDYAYVGGTYVTDEIQGVWDFGNPNDFADKYYSLGVSAGLPLYFDGGAWGQSLNPYVSWSYNNGLVPDLDNITHEIVDGEQKKFVPLKSGLDKLSLGLSYSLSSRAAVRDFAPPWAFSFSGAYSLSPSNREFAKLLSLYASVYTPGVLPNNSFSAAFTFQNSLDFNDVNGTKTMMFKSGALVPRGYTTNDIVNLNYAAVSLNYQLPLLHPEGGLRSILYVKRIRLNAGFDYARFDYPTSGKGDIYSWGGDLIFDLNAFRLPAAGTTAVEFSLYKRSVGDIFTEFGLVLPF